MSQQTLPLLPIQERFWFLRHIEHGQGNLIQAAYPISEPFNAADIQGRLDQLVQKYDALRIILQENGDEANQSIQESAAQKVALIEANGGNFREYLATTAYQMTDAASDWLLQVEIFHPSEGQDMLLLTAHRLICDVASLDIIASELLSPDNGITSSALDFEAYVKSAVAEDLSTSLKSWSQKLEDSIHVCELPLDCPRPANQQGAIARYACQFNEDVISAVDKLADSAHVDVAAVWTAAYLTLLYRYTLQDDILLGWAQRGANSDELGIAPLMDTAVIRQLFTPEMTFADLLAAVNTSLAEISSQTPPPFPKLLEVLKPERSLNRAPVIQHGIYYNSTQSNLSYAYSSPALSQLDTMLHINADHSVEWHYDSNIFNKATIQRVQQHLEKCLLSAAQNVDTPLVQLNLLPPAEQELLTITWNETDHPVPDNDYVYRLFEKQATRTPEAVAASEPNRQITYEEQNRRSNRLAHHLVEKGIGKNVIVPILADRDIHYQTMMLAINKAGGAFLPLSPTYPPKRLATIFTRTETSLILVDETYRAVIEEALQEMPEDKRPEVEVSLYTTEYDYPDENLPARCGMDDIAYIMFTSGSTGEPKGVMVHHAGMINHNNAKLGDLEMGAADILAQTSRQSFDIVVWQFLAPLIVGGSIFIMPDDMALDPAELLKATDEHGITVLQLVPINIEALLDVAGVMGEQKPKLQQLRWMVPTGDALQTDLCRRWLNLYPHTRMLNTYGATECSDDQCHYVIAESPSEHYRPAIMTIGTPIYNTKVYILDEAMQPVPIGVVGELYISGVGVGPGYLKDEERTAKTFVPNPFSENKASKLYRSGDQARYLSDGSIEFLGRIGHLIKIRGMRIEPGEIQAVLSRHPQIAQAVLTVHEFPGLGQHLIAYIVPRTGEAMSEEDIKLYLRQYLPDYMIPSYFVSLDEMPLNANGKIDRKKLPLPEIAAKQSVIVAPRTETEESLLTIWRKILNRTEISIYDNFFDIGGYSLLAMRLFTQIQQKFGKRLPLATIFKATTIADLATLLESDSSDTNSDDFLCLVPIQAGNPERPPFFCIHAHGGHVIYFHELARHLGTDQPFYGIQALGIDGNHAPPHRFEEYAEVYVREIRKVQSEGPYYIGGECMGGTIAYEVVRQLEEQGQQVALLVMFDAYCAGIPTLQKGVPMWLYEVMFNVRRSQKLYISKLSNVPREELLHSLADIADRTAMTLKRIFLSRWLAKTDINDPLSVTHAALWDAQEAYKPSCISTPITLFNSELPWGVTDDETLGWQGHTEGDIEIVSLPTLFDTLIEGPDVKLTAKRLREILDRKIEQEAKPI